MENSIVLYKRSLDTLRSALALGADKAIHVLTDMPIDKVYFKY